MNWAPLNFKDYLNVQIGDYVKFGNYSKLVEDQKMIDGKCYKVLEIDINDFGHRLFKIKNELGQETRYHPEWFVAYFKNSEMLELLYG